MWHHFDLDELRSAWLPDILSFRRRFKMAVG